MSDRAQADFAAIARLKDYCNHPRSGLSLGAARRCLSLLVQRDAQLKKLQTCVEAALELQVTRFVDFDKYGFKSDSDIEAMYRSALGAQS